MPLRRLRPVIRVHPGWCLPPIVGARWPARDRLSAARVRSDRSESDGLPFEFRLAGPAAIARGWASRVRHIAGPSAHRRLSYRQPRSAARVARPPQARGSSDPGGGDRAVCPHLLTGRQSPRGTRAVSPHWLTGRQSRRGARAVSPRWLTGRQSPGGTRAVSLPPGHTGRRSPRGTRAVSPHRRTGHQSPRGPRAVSPRGARAAAHGPSVPRRIDNRLSVRHSLRAVSASVLCSPGRVVPDRPLAVSGIVGPIATLFDMRIDRGRGAVEHLGPLPTRARASD